MANTTILHALNDWRHATPNDSAHAWKVGSEWKFKSITTVCEEVVALARFFQSSGGNLPVGAIYASGSSEWMTTDIGLMLAGGVSAGIYLNASKSQWAHVIKQSEAVFLFVDQWKDIEKIIGSEVKSFSELKVEFPHLQKVILYREEPRSGLGPEVISFQSAIAQGRTISNQSFEDFLRKIQPDQLATLIYTSGTTGVPKGVALSHRNMAFAAECYSATWTPPKTGRLFSFLPLPHIAERVTTLINGIARRYTIYFSSGPMALASELREVQPTILVAVPRLWDKLHEGVENRLAKLEPKQLKVARWAMKSADEYWTAQLAGKSFLRPDLFLKWKLADVLVLKKIRHQLGLSQAARTVSGAASLPVQITNWYRSIGVNLIEAYALSETCGILTCGNPKEQTGGTVGRTYPGIHLRLAKDGEIEVSGHNVFMGYYKDPESTAAMIQDGWLRTGDLGVIDDKGFLKIVGRKREIIKTSEGKMISPLLIEAKLQSIPEVEQAVVIGNEKPHLVALFTLRAELEGPQDEVLARIQKILVLLNKELASHERVKAFRVLPEGLSIEKGELTATMKVRRHAVEERHRHLIHEMYNS